LASSEGEEAELKKKKKKKIKKLGDIDRDCQKRMGGGQAGTRLKKGKEVRKVIWERVGSPG